MGLLRYKLYLPALIQIEVQNAIMGVINAVLYDGCLSSFYLSPGSLYQESRDIWQATGRVLDVRLLRWR